MGDPKEADTLDLKHQRHRPAGKRAMKGQHSHIRHSNTEIFFQLPPP